MANTIQIDYLDQDGNLVGTYQTGEDNTPEIRAEWDRWLNDSAVEHPGAPAEWSEYRLVSGA